jgi:hypothetical protein
VSVYDRAQQILDSVVDCLDDVPDRHYVQSGEVAWDCEQLVLSVVRIIPGSINTAVSQGSIMCAPWTVQAELWRLWCVPQAVKGIPTLAQMADGGEIATRGGEALRAAAFDAVGACSGCGARLTGATTIGHQGGYVAWRVDIEWTL